MGSEHLRLRVKGDYASANCGFGHRTWQVVPMQVVLSRMEPEISPVKPYRAIFNVIRPTRFYRVVFPSFEMSQFQTFDCAAGCYQYQYLQRSIKTYSDY